MKNQLKAALVGVGASALLLLGALLVAPFFLKDRVIELVERQINERLDATVQAAALCAYVDGYLAPEERERR